MNGFTYNLVLAVVTFMLIIAGCESPVTTQPKQPISSAEIIAQYQPAKVVFLPLTEMKAAEQEHLSEEITAFISLNDGVNSSIKAPGTFRFEIYQSAPLTSKGRSKRLKLWGDIDLTEFENNSKYWRDYLRCYEFKLEYDGIVMGKYILEMTFICPSGKRISAETVLSKN